MNPKSQNPFSITIAIPVYKGSDTLRFALNSVVPQLTQYTDIIVLDDNKPEWKEETLKTINIVTSYKSKKIKYLKNDMNLGCQQTIAKLAKLAKGDIILYLAQDDVCSSDIVAQIQNTFMKYPDICLVTRPYYWFETSYKKPVRAVQPVDQKNDSLLSLFDGQKSIQAVFGSVGQISGLAYRKKFLKPFHTDLFPGHIYPIAEMFKEHPILMLHDYTVAVSIGSSQTRKNSTIYNTSPTRQWVKMFTKIYKGKQYRGIRQRCIKHIATHYAGLVQIKNYGPFSALLREIQILIRSYPFNLLQPKFWFYSILVIITPRFILRRLTDWYKRTIIAKTIPSIRFVTTAYHE